MEQGPYLAADERAVLRVLQCRDHEWHSIEQIAVETEMPRRSVEAALEVLRGQVPLVPSSRGIRIAATRAEAERGLRAYERRLLTMLRQRSRIKRVVYAMGEGWKVEETPELGL